MPWDQLEKRTSPTTWKLLNDEILKLRDEGQVLHTFKELRETLRGRLGELRGGLTMSIWRRSSGCWTGRGW